MTGSGQIPGSRHSLGRAQAPNDASAGPRDHDEPAIPAVDSHPLPDANDAASQDLNPDANDAASPPAGEGPGDDSDGRYGGYVPV